MSCSVLEKRNVQNLTSESAERKIRLEALPRRGAERRSARLASPRSCHVRIRAGGGYLVVFMRVEWGEDVDISPLTHLGEKTKVSGGRATFRGICVGRARLRPGCVCGSGGRVKFWGAKKKNTSMNASDTGTCWVKFHFFIVSAPA